MTNPAPRTPASSWSSVLAVPEPPPPTGFLLGLDDQGRRAVETLLWRPLDRLRCLACGDQGVPQLLSRGGGEDEAPAGVLAEDVLGGFVFHRDWGGAAAALLKARPELLEPALTLGIGLDLGADTPHPLRGLVDMPVGLPATQELDRQFYWLVHDLHAVLFTRALICVDVVDVLMSVDRCERVFFASVTGPDPAQVTDQAIRLLEAQGLERHRVQGLLGVLSSDPRVDLKTYEILHRAALDWLPEDAVSASTVRAYPRGLDGLYRISLYGARRADT